MELTGAFLQDLEFRVSHFLFLELMLLQNVCIECIECVECDGAYETRSQRKAWILPRQTRLGSKRDGQNGGSLLLSSVPKITRAFLIMFKLRMYPLLGIRAKDLQAGTQTDACIPILIAALFTTAKRWKQHVSIEGWVDKQKVIYSYNVKYLTLKQEAHFSICHSMDKPWRHHLKLNKLVTKGQALYESTYMRSLE